MSKLRFFLLLFLAFSAGCTQSKRELPTELDNVPAQLNHSSGLENSNRHGRGALLLTSFKSFEELKSAVQIEYSGDTSRSNFVFWKKPQVRAIHISSGREVTTLLKSGIHQGDFLTAKAGNFWDHVWLGLRSPYTLIHREEIVSIEILGRRRNTMFGEGDVAFYDIAEAMVYHISDDDLMYMPPEDLTEKGYLNTFNHLTAQALMTSIFSERLADFISDVHERYHIPEMITGVYAEDQIADLEDGPLDNFIDMLNNEWGQELGKLLSKKYSINRDTYWTPELLADYLNDVQSYNSWAFQIKLNPFRSTDDIIIRYSHKINQVVHNFSELTRNYY